MNNSPKDYLTDRKTTREIKNDYVVVKTMEEALALITHKAPKSLQGKYVIVAPNGLKFVSKEDIAKLPQVKALLTSEVEKTLKRIDEKMIENFGKGNYMDKQANKVDCRNCYIDGFTDCMSKFRKALSDIGGRV